MASEQDRDVDSRVDRAITRAVDKVDRAAARISEKAARHEQRAAKATEQAAALDRYTDRHARIAAKAADKAAVLARVGDGLAALDIWTRVEPAARRPRLSREAIAATATRIADTEGFDSLSMRRLAAELDAGTMTLYHYVRTKDELLALVVDYVMGELLSPPDEPMPATWREAVAGIARRTRAALERHPWIIDLTDDPPLGPNSVRHFDQSMQAVASLDVPLVDRFDIVSAVDEYVFGYSLQHRNVGAATGDGAEEREMLGYVNGLVATGDYPQLAALADEYGLEESWRQIREHLANPDRFERNLQRLLDGFEADLHARD